VASAALFDQEYTDDDRRQELEVQEAIAVCMAKEGFEYIPYVPNNDDSGYGAAQTEEEYAQEYGLGVSHYVLNQEFYEERGNDEEESEEGGDAGGGDSLESGQAAAESGPGEDGDASDAEGEAGHSEDDPNHRIWEAMSEDEREAYDEALDGVYPESELDKMTEEEYEALPDDERDAMAEEYEAQMEGWDPGGCQSEVRGKLWDEGTYAAFGEQFGDQLEDTLKEAEADPRIAEIDSEWPKCMSGAGYAFDDEEDAAAHVVGLLEEIGAVSVPAGAEGAWQFEPKPIEAGSDIFKEVEAIFKEEVAIAEASLKCREGAYEIYEAVYKEFEQAFIDNNRAALEQFRKENS